MRIYSNYTPAEYEAVASLADELGFSLSAFQHYCVMLHANQKETAMTMDHLLSTMLHHLDLKKSGDTFIVSSFLHLGFITVFFIQKREDDSGQAAFPPYQGKRQQIRSIQSGPGKDHHLQKTLRNAAWSEDRFSRRSPSPERREAPCSM